MLESVPDLGKEMDMQTQKCKEATPRHTVIRVSKVKDRILKVREKQLVIYEGIPIRLIAFLSRNFSGQKVAAA